MAHDHSPQIDLDRLVCDAASLWCARSKQAALNLVASTVRHGKNNAMLSAAINRRQNQLLSLSRTPWFRLEDELRRLAVDIAGL